MRHLLGSLLLFLLMVSSCKKENEIIDLHLDYFPLEIGTWIIYDVDSIAYNDFTFTVDTFYFQVKEVVAADFTDNEGREAQRIERFYRQHPDSAWVIKNVWTANRTLKTAERVEHNVRFIKLVFPLGNSVSWDGNKANTRDEVTYEYDGIHEPFTMGSLSFDSCLFVQQENELTLFSHKYGREVYAKHIGKVFLSKINLVKLVDGTITSGYNYSYKAVAWGQ